VTSWLASNVEGATPPVTFELIAGGRSNLTYRVEDALDHVYALRRPPISHVLPTAHDVTREHRIMTALFPTGVPVPRTLGICSDVSINGAPFLVMEFVDGHVVRDAADAVAMSSATRRAIGPNMAETLAELHGIDTQSIGVGDFGRPDGYIDRQIRRWSEQYRSTVGSRYDDLVLGVASRLSSLVPTQQGSGIVHGDYRLDNVVVDDVGRVRAVLDWEISTTGDPLADVGLLMVYWAEPGDGEDFLGATPATTAPDFSTREELLTCYESASGRDLSDIGFYMAFGYWKLACILQGVFTRYSAGAKAGDQTSVDVYPRTIGRLAELAATTLESR
jgi:aminoglycoside phosphotransferase (APT) family kinase protein